MLDPSQASIFDLLAKLQENPNHMNDKDDEQQMEVESEAESEIQVAKQVVRYEYQHERTFDDEKSCFEFIEAEKSWSRKQLVKQNVGLKTIYRCSHCKLRGGPCSAGIYTISNSSPEDQTFKLYRKNAKHDHDSSENKVSKLSDELNAMIKGYVQEGLTLKKILFRLRDNKEIEQPEKNQVMSAIKRVRKELFGDAAISVQDMVEFCKQHSKIPDDIDTAFVLAFEHSKISGSDEEESDDDDESDDEDTDKPVKGNWIRYIVTTKRLLMNSAQSKIIHADATYKIVIQRFPVLNFGTTDQDNTQHFHLMAMMVSNYERKADYAFAFKALRNGVKSVTDNLFNPSVVMADAAAAIGNAFKLTFGNNVTVLMCFTHVIAAVDRKAMVHKDSKALIKSDIRKLRFAPNKPAFDTACSLFIEKWTSRETVFIQYFKKTWINRNSNWFSGAHYRVPTTNNALEGYHSGLKMHQTYWRQKGIAEFKASIFLCSKIFLM